MSGGMGGLGGLGGECECEVERLGGVMKAGAGVEEVE